MPSLRRARRSSAMRAVACALIGALLVALVPLDASAAIPSPVVAASRGLTEAVDLAAVSLAEAAAVSRLARSGSGLPVTVAVIVWNPSILAKSAFGELLAHTGNDPQPYAFTGEPYDPNVGWQYHRARWMDPRVGRFAGMDPFGGSESSPATLHRYTYAANSPTKYTDPSGRNFMSATASIGFVLALAAVAVVAPLLGAIPRRRNLNNPVTLHTQPIIQENSAWTVGDAMQTLHLAAEFWREQAGIVVIPQRPIVVKGPLAVDAALEVEFALNGQKSWEYADSLLDDLPTRQRHVTVFATYLSGSLGFGPPIPPPSRHAGRAFAWVAQAGSAHTLMHEWGHTFGLPHAWIGLPFFSPHLNLMQYFPFGAKLLTPMQVDLARMMAARF